MILQYHPNVFKHEYRKVCEQDYNAGYDWYDNARNKARELSVRYSLTLEQVCACIAVLSPQVEWNLNLEAANIVIRHWQTKRRIPVVAGFKTNRMKCKPILRDNDLSVVRGMKVTAFFDNLLRVDSPRVTLDRWMFRLLTNDPNEDGRTFYGSPKRYGYVEHLLNYTACELSIPAQKLQAILWLHAKRKWES